MFVNISAPLPGLHSKLECAVVKALDVSIVIQDTSGSDDIMAVINALPLQVCVTAVLQYSMHAACHFQKNMRNAAVVASHC